MKNAPDIEEITPEYVMQLGDELIDALLDATPAELAMKHYTVKERLAGLDPKERLAGLDVKERLAGLTPEQIRRFLEQLEKTNEQ